MFGLSRKKTARPEQLAELTGAAPQFGASSDGVSATLHGSFRVLEIATLTLDGIAHGLSEARMLARSAARPDGAAQRGLIAARYAFLKEDIERRFAEQALINGDAIAIAWGAEKDGAASGSFTTQDLPPCTFKTAEEARALADVIERTLRMVEEDSHRIRDAAGHIADRIVEAAAAPKTEMPAQTAAAIVKPASQRRRRAA